MDKAFAQELLQEWRIIDRHQHRILKPAEPGQGIPTDDLERIFEFYYTTKDEGTGLGLSIAQRIVHQHGATLLVESGEGEGTQISIRLPGIQSQL